eukprot:PITA_21100
MKTELELWQRPVSESMMFYVGLPTAVIFVVLTAAWSFYSRGSKERLPPGPFSWPIIGNLHMLGELPHRALEALSMKYGPLMSVRFGSALSLVVSSPEMAKEFLKTHDLRFANKPPSAATKQLSFNFEGIAFAPYSPYWRHMRKFCVVELLCPKRLEYFSSIREEEVSALIRFIVNSDDSLPLNIKQTLTSFWTAINCRTACGRKYSEQDLSAFSSMVRESFLLMGSFNIGDVVPYLDWMDLQGFNRRMRKVHKEHDQLLEKIIDEHVARNDPNITHNFVDALLAASADKDREVEISRNSIKGVLFDMLVSGAETAPTAIEWAMSEALRNPLVMKKLQDELESVVGMDRMVCESDLPKLPYLQAAVKETLRLHPSGPFLVRYLPGTSCNVLGYEIPQNTRVLVNVWAIMRSPKCWKDPENFMPERFMERVGSEVDENGDQNFACLLFGAGRRRCPAQQMGTLVAEFGLAQLLHCFNWRLPFDDTSAQTEDMDMTERFNGVTLAKARELWAIPTPRLKCISQAK